MVKSKVYGIHLRVDSDHNVTLQAYTLRPSLENKDGFVFDEPIGEQFTRNIDDRRSANIISQVFDLRGWENRGDWRDYEWKGFSTYLIDGEFASTKAVSDWYRSLPEYEVSL